MRATSEMSTVGTETTIHGIHAKLTMNVGGGVGGERVGGFVEIFSICVGL